jgi:hypothetical protein
MASEPLGAKQRAVSAILFLTAAMTTLDAYSTLNSSPWTSENFGADEYKASSSRRYVRHAIVFSTAYALASAMIAESLWPLVGSTIANVYLWHLYETALAKGAATGSTGWRNG